MRIAASGAVGIGTTSPAATALLDLTSTTKGFLPPRMTTTQRDAISSPAEGLTVYNTTTDALNIYTGSAWGAVGGGADLDALSDVTITSAASNDTLRYNGSAWVNVPINTAMTTTTMEANWPDAIMCTANDGGGGIYTDWILQKTLNVDSSGQKYYAGYGGGSWIHIIFNSSGSFVSENYVGTLTCAGTTTPTISGLYAAGKAFNFIGTGAVTTFDVGTASAPGLAVTSDSNTGFYQNGTADTLGIALGGAGEVLFTATATSPVTSDGNALGTGTLMWSDLFLASGAVINFNNGDVTATHAANTLAFAGASTAYSFDSGVGIGTTSVAASSLLDIVSTTKGFLPPRMTTTQRDAVSSPAEGLTIYNTTTDALNVYTGSAWGAVGGAGAIDDLSDVTLTSPASGNVLQYNGSAWVNVAASTAMGTTTMVPNWPDAIQCNNSPAAALMQFAYKDATSAYYKYMANNSGDVYITYNPSTGAYTGASGFITTFDCVTSSKSITTLYSQGYAFNFIGTGAVTTFNAGTASAPGLAVTSDTNTGLWSAGADTLNFSTGGTERMRVDSSGNVLINTTGHVIGAKLQLTFDGNSEQGMTIKNSSGSANGAAIRFIDSGDGYSGGGIYFTSSAAVTYSSASDIRLKENIRPATGALAKVSAIEVVDFNFKSDPAKKQLNGFIAQDLYKYYPESVVVGDEDVTKKAWSVDYGRVTPLIVRALQELKALLDELAAKVEELIAQLIGHDEAITKLQAANDNQETELKALRLENKRLRDDVDDLRKAFEAFRAAPRADNDNAPLPGVRADLPSPKRSVGFAQAGNDNDRPEVLMKATHR